MMVGKVEMPSRAYVAAFGFKGPDQQKPVKVLSGGERNRLNLAMTLKIGGNVLLLDEPTNDLDVETLSSLENALLEFPGCAVVISHDRMFLDRVTTHMLAWEGTDEDPDKWFWFEGNYDAYEKNKIDRLGADAARPHRVTYRKLTATDCRASVRFIYDVAVRWSDMDAYGHVNNARFLTLYEEARVAMFFVGARAHGLGSFEEGIVIARHEIDYLRPVDYGDPVRIEMWVSRAAGRSLHRRRTSCSTTTCWPAGRSRSACRTTWPSGTRAG